MGIETPQPSYKHRGRSPYPLDMSSTTTVTDGIAYTQGPTHLIAAGTSGSAALPLVPADGSGGIIEARLIVVHNSHASQLAFILLGDSTVAIGNTAPAAGTSQKCLFIPPGQSRTLLLTPDFTHISTLASGANTNLYISVMGIRNLK
jgi:hypothetical protein